MEQNAYSFFICDWKYQGYVWIFLVGIKGSFWYQNNLAFLCFTTLWLLLPCPPNREGSNGMWEKELIIDIHWRQPQTLVSHFNGGPFDGFYLSCMLGRVYNVHIYSRRKFLWKEPKTENLETHINLTKIEITKEGFATKRISNGLPRLKICNGISDCALWKKPCWCQFPCAHIFQTTRNNSPLPTGPWRNYTWANWYLWSKAAKSWEKGLMLEAQSRAWVRHLSQVGLKYHQRY